MHKFWYLGLLIFWIKSVDASNLALDMQKPISLNVEQVEIQVVLQKLAQFIGINMVMSEAVHGRISLHLKKVPWQQALDIILATKGLNKEQKGNILLIDDAILMTKRAKNLLKEKKAAQALLPLHAQLIPIKYAKASDIALMLKDKANSLLSSRGAVSVDPRTNSIWLQDTLQQMRVIKRLINELDIPVRQVEIEARIVSMNKDCARDLGIRFGLSNSPVNPANGIPTPALPFADRLNIDLAATPIEATPASVGIVLAKLSNHVLLDMELSALESEGRAQIIASPRLITTNQQPALIESGEDIPYQESTLSGATAVSFKKAVLSLKVTPQITPNGKLLLALFINHDSDSGRRVQGVPIIMTKSIETTVLVDHGQTIVLGGIYKRDKSKNIARVPILGSLPGLEYLFSRTQIQIKNEELLIFITPRIITRDSLMTSVEK